MAAVRSLPIPAADEIPPGEQSQVSMLCPPDTKSADQYHQNLMVPITSRSRSYDASPNLSPSHPAFSLPSPPSPLALPSSGAPLLRGRSKTLASLTTVSKNNSQADMTPLELHLPREPSVNGQPVEAYLYKDASECPICFLYYPPYLNRTRCCDQSICSECFVQIKRPDPHPPEHSDPISHSTGDGIQASDVDEDSNLVSEPAACPFCVQPEFGITYDSPPFRRGLVYVNQPSASTLGNAASAMSSSSSLSSVSGGGGITQTIPARRRTTSVSATSPNVITTDRVRPDWAQKLSSARAHAARRSAAATALHTAAYLMGGQGVDARGFGGFGRRAVLRRGTGADSPSSGNSSTQLNALALLAERHGPSGAPNEMSNFADRGPSMLAPPPRGSSRRSRIEDLEDMMMMEAIRLSLASEEDRKKKEDKEAKKEAKKKEKEAKKAEKAAKKTGMYSNSSNPSSSVLDGATPTFLEEQQTMLDKGKGIDRSRNGVSPLPFASQRESAAYLASPSSQAAEDPRSLVDLGPAQVQPYNATNSTSPFGCEPPKPSHLRHISNASSSASSFAESLPRSLKNGLGGSNSSFEPSLSTSGLHIPSGDTVADTHGSATPGGGAGTEPMFNFRSLAAMIDDEEKELTTTHIEDIHHHVEIPDDLLRGGRSNHESPDRSYGGDSLTLAQSTATLNARTALEGPSGNATVDTPGVMVTSPSQVNFQCKSDPNSNSVNETELFKTERTEHHHQLTS